jgi:ketosteroid isomerase-like protein
MKADVVRALFAAYYSKDRGALERILTGDFTFTSPYDDRIDKAEYFRRCWPTSQHIKGHTLEKIIELGDEAILQYECTMLDGKTFRNVEVMTFDGDRVRSVDVYFGAAYRDGRFEKWQ